MEIGFRANGPDWSAVTSHIRARQQAVASRTDAAKTPPSAGPSQADQAVIADLKARDREVRAHEQAHATVGGQYAGSPTYSYQAGPDGQQYAVGGEVQIDTSPVPDDPEATIAKMDVVEAAALAPAEPSSADRKVAALASALRAQALADLTELRAAERGHSVDMRV